MRALLIATALLAVAFLGDKRTIKKVEFTYRSEHHGDKAEIVLFGVEK